MEENKNNVKNIKKVLSKCTGAFKIKIIKKLGK